MKWVEFKTTAQFESLGRRNGPTFEAGSRHHLEDDFADRWIRRGVAIVVEGPAAEPAQPEETTSKEPVGDEPKERSRRSKAASAES